MLKKLFFVALLTTFAIVSASAQTKVDKYLGTWKLTNPPKNSKLKTITLNVSVDGELLKIEKITDEIRDGKDYSTTIINPYKLSGGTLTFFPGKMSEPGSTYLQYPSDGKLRLFLEWGVMTTREDWSLSGDDKTLTAQSRRYGSSMKFVYAKQ
jgi:hypothetical protein